MYALERQNWLNASIYIGPSFNLIHLLSMAMFLGALWMVDLRLLGGALTRRPVADVARDAQPWLVAGFLGLIITGIPAFMATASAQVKNPVFHTKMGVLLVATIFPFVVRRKVTQVDEARVGPIWFKLVAFVSICLWVTVATAARLIMLL
jgi:hypothetical protein